MVNPTGSNGTDNGVFPPDTELRKILFDYARRSLRLNLRLRYLERDHQITIGLTKLKALNRQFDVPTARKFKAVEEATSAIADIIARDVHQSQGPDTVKKVMSLRLNLTVPRAFVRSTMKGLVGQCPSDMRMPGRGKGPKQRSALNAIGIFQEIHTDGHEKLGEKALQMGSGIGIDTYGMRDHVGKVLWLVVIPNSRLSDTIGHVFLDMVSKYGAISVQVTFDGGSELGWLAAFQTTLREVFAPDLSAEEWKPVVAVKSTSNIPIESTWSYDRKFNGRSMRDILEEGRIHLIPGDVVHRELFRWLWPKIVQIGLDEFVDYFNNKKTRKQRGRILPSGVAPNVVFDMPGDYGLENLAIPVAQEAIDELRTLIDTSREEAYRWVSDEFDAFASEVYIQLGCPKLEALSGWAIFNAMAPLVGQRII
ncbi:hypothetical protein DFH08DRAFT_750059 [Mycena albidolilacea]|uniref:Uncharacterized protein n=1 Tax=Mycena albidolilacea TaxID=1033008 RepID=A0AAD6ZQ40_9AGAR|nr:hypothetical protein DFH08DRAFT_750059 [Mycena albidolilacea]